MLASRSGRHADRARPGEPHHERAAGGGLEGGCPIDILWSKLPRVIRDLSATCGKTVHLEMEGRETELDRTILEAVKDPLTHLVRNAVDHGIESPEDRLAAGKDEQGLLLLRAFHEGGQVNIEIRTTAQASTPS